MNQNINNKFNTIVSDIIYIRDNMSGKEYSNFRGLFGKIQRECFEFDLLLRGFIISDIKEYQEVKK